MDTFPGGYVGFGLAAMLTHAALGYTLGSIVFDRPKAGAIGGLLPDCDFLFPAFLDAPFIHRGITHSALAAGVMVAYIAQYDKRIAASAGIGYLSHLLVDATTPKGVAIGYPFVTENVAVVLRGHSPMASLVIWTCCLSALLFQYSRNTWAVE